MRAGIATVALVLVSARALAADAGSCPSMVPDAGSACDPLFLACELGGDVHGHCTTLATCEANGKWSVAPAGCRSNPPECRPFATTDQPCPLTKPDDLCFFPEGVCACTQCWLNAVQTTQYVCSPSPANHHRDARRSSRLARFHSRTLIRRTQVPQTRPGSTVASATRARAAAAESKARRALRWPW